jgi:hypothetical protein
MVKNPIIAELWQPVSFIRQQMLANSYSYLPLYAEEGWRVVSDSAIANYLGPKTGVESRRLLATPLRDASILLSEAMFVDEKTPLGDALSCLVATPLLLVKNPFTPDSLLGIVAAFDLLQLTAILPKQI